MYTTALYGSSVACLLCHFSLIKLSPDQEEVEEWICKECEASFSFWWGVVRCLFFMRLSIPVRDRCPELALTF